MLNIVRHCGIVVWLLLISLVFSSGCTNSGVNITVPVIDPPVIESFTAIPNSISPGQKVELAWNVVGATEISIQPDIQNSSASGNITLMPDSTTTYILNAKNSAGWVTGTVIVDVKVMYSQQNIIAYDPVTGRNSDIFVMLEQLSFSTEYQVQIAKDPNFSLMVYDSGLYAPPSVTAPTFHYNQGGVLEAGHTYFMRYRTRQVATGQWIRSPWSEVAVFTVDSGLPITSPR
jgi:hypothetical protein